MTTTGPELPPPPDPNWVQPVNSPQPGDLGIREKRSWATWQFITAIVIAALIGMAIGHSGGSSSAAGGAGGGQTLRTLPPESTGPSGATATTVAGATGTSSSIASNAGASTTTSAGGTSTTTKSGASTTTTAPPGPQAYLIHNLQGTGPTNLPALKIAGGQWTIGWAYRCVLAPGGAAKFQILGAATPVNEQGRNGSGTTQESKAGAQQLRIVTDPACAWAVTVVGVAG